MAEDDGYVVRARGLPWSTTADDMKTFFEGCNIVDSPDSIKFTFNSSGRPSGECFVEFETDDDMQEALKKDKNYIQDRYVELFKSKRSEMVWVTNRNSGGAESSEGLIKCRGLPFGCSKEEIAEFFSGLTIQANGITLPQDQDGRMTGEAFVLFASKDIAEKALRKHKSHMGHRYIEVFKSYPDELRRATNPGRGGRGMNRPGPYDRYPGGGQGGRGRARNSGFERRYGGGGGGDGYGGYDNDFNYGFHGGYGGGGGGGSYGSGGGGGGFGSRRGGGGGGGWGGNPQPLFPRGGRGGGGGGGDYRRGGGGRGGGGSDMGTDYVSTTGHSIHMRGLPFSVTEHEIESFFQGTAMPCNIVIHDVNGKRSGFADVDFQSHEEAKAAMKKDRKNIGSRYIELFLHSGDGGSGGGGGGGGRGFGSGGGAKAGKGGFGGGRGGRGGGGGGGGYRDNQMGGFGGGGGGGFYGSGGGGGGNNYGGGYN